MKNQYYITCVADNDNQININYPHQIRRRLNKLIVKESLMNNGYYCCNLNQVTYLKHRILLTRLIKFKSIT